MSKFSAFLKSEPVFFGHRAKCWVASAVFGYFALTLMACGRAVQPGVSNTLKPSPELVLRQMSDKLARANQITFKVIQEFRAAPPDGETEYARTEIDIATARFKLRSRAR